MKTSHTIKGILAVLIAIASTYAIEVNAQQANVIKAGTLGVPVPFVTADTDMISEDKLCIRGNYSQGTSMSKIQTYLTQNNVALYASGSENNNGLHVKTSQAYQR